MVEWWPLTGWLTSGVMAAILFLGSDLSPLTSQLSTLPWSLAVLLAIIARILITGALHEDGLADFFDGFGGGGTNRERILAIMKDSHIGTYGVLGLILYLALLYLCLYNMPPLTACLTVLMADPFAKMLTAQMTQMMPYARTAETSKAHTVYRRMSLTSGILLAIQGLLTMAIYFLLTSDLIPTIQHLPPNTQHLTPLTYQHLFVPCLVMYFMYLFVWRRLRGYTGDCCGAFFLLIELSIYLTAVLSTQ